jgi:F0F1-type ATP synthase assembly protein I
MTDLDKISPNQEELVGTIEEQLTRMGEELEKSHQEHLKFNQDIRTKKGYPMLVAMVAGVALLGIVIHLFLILIIILGPVGVIANSALIGIGAAIGGAITG